MARTWECRLCGEVYYSQQRECSECGHTIFNKPDTEKLTSADPDGDGVSLDDGSAVSGIGRPPAPESDTDTENQDESDDPDRPPLLEGLPSGRVYSTGEVAAHAGLEERDVEARLTRLADDGWIDHPTPEGWRVPDPENDTDE